MFSFFKSDPVKKLRDHYDRKLTQAMNAQRNGDIRNYGFLTEEATELYRQIQELEAKQ